MKIVKSTRDWEDSCYFLFLDVVAFLTFRFYLIDRGFYLKPNGRRFKIWWFWACRIPEELVEVLTLGYWSLR